MYENMGDTAPSAAAILKEPYDMTTDKVEEMEEKLITRQSDPILGVLRHEYEFIDPHKLATVLVEMEERIENYDEQPRNNKWAYGCGYQAGKKAGALAALEEVRNSLREGYLQSLAYGAVCNLLDELKKKYE